ncbi:MAG: hypothetical protein ACI9NT_001119 [Bacteroidia bacterium]|jgi:hypothetical protein
MYALYKILLIALSAIFLIGCASTRHDWGNYESELYTYYKSPTPEEQQELVNELATTFARTEKKGVSPPPGLYAEYGTFLFQEGDYPNAIQFYEKEKIAWPESAKFMDSLISTLQQRVDAGEIQEATETDNE